MPLILLVATSSVIATMTTCLHWLGVDVHYHPRAFIAIVSAFELLQNLGRGICGFVPISVHEAFLDIVEALARLCLMLLADVLRGVSETSFL